MLKIKTFIVLFIFGALLSTPVFAQHNHDEGTGEDGDLLPEELLELENQEAASAEKKQMLPKELQQNFIIVESVHQHELNPQLTNYSSDSQILNGLFEGLFTINPINLQPQYAIAKDFKISRDKKRWTIILRDDAKFSNGEKITA